MAKIPESTKLERLERVETLLRRSNGITEKEIAEALHFERRTTHNYLRDLETAGRAEKQGKLWYALSSRPFVLRKLELHPEQAMVLYLAARLFVKQSDQRNETAETVLLKFSRPQRIGAV